MHSLKILLGQFLVRPHRVQIETNQQILGPYRTSQMCHLEGPKIEMHLIFKCLFYYAVKDHYYSISWFEELHLHFLLISYPKLPCSIHDRNSQPQISIFSCPPVLRPPRGSPHTFRLPHPIEATSNWQNTNIPQTIDQWSLGPLLNLWPSPPWCPTDNFKPYEELLCQVTDHTQSN